MIENRKNGSLVYSMLWSWPNGVLVAIFIAELISLIVYWWPGSDAWWGTP